MIFILRSKIKHSPIFIQVSISPHNKVCLPKYLLTGTACPAFNKKSQSMEKARKNKNILKRKAVLKTRLTYDTDDGIIRQGI